MVQGSFSVAPDWNSPSPLSFQTHIRHLRAGHLQIALIIGRHPSRKLLVWLQLIRCIMHDNLVFPFCWPFSSNSSPHDYVFDGEVCFITSVRHANTIICRNDTSTFYALRTSNVSWILQLRNTCRLPGGLWMSSSLSIWVSWKLWKLYACDIGGEVRL